MRRWEFIDQLIKENEFRSGAELGTWDCRTFSYLLKNNPKLKLLGIDLYEPQPANPGPEKWTPGENGHPWDHKTYYKTALRLCQQYEGASFIRDYTTNAVQQVEDRSFDFVFIDADHGYNAVKRDIIDWWDKITFGGMMIGHDIDWPEVKQAVEEIFPRYNIGPDNCWYVTKLFFKP